MAITEVLRGREEYGDDIAPLLEQVKKDYELTMSGIAALKAETAAE